jgi:saccharopine dehydrogenase-like NADP-dependent oxidoreductase
MYHEFEYKLEGVNRKIVSSMLNIGEDEVYTAMSNTVGLPVAICAKMILTGQIHEKGVTLPVNKPVYKPILEELKAFNITFEEHESILED